MKDGSKSVHQIIDRDRDRNPDVLCLKYEESRAHTVQRSAESHGPFDGGNTREYPRPRGATIKLEEPAKPELSARNFCL